MHVASCSNVVLEAQVRSAARLRSTSENVKIRTTIKPAIKRAHNPMDFSLVFERIIRRQFDCCQFANSQPAAGWQSLANGESLFNTNIDHNFASRYCRDRISDFAAAIAYARINQGSQTAMIIFWRNFVGCFVLTLCLSELASAAEPRPVTLQEWDAVVKRAEDEGE